jgi:penicillin-binding protein 2
VVLVIAILVLRLWSLQLIHGAEYTAASVNNRIRMATTAAPRGRILDRNGKELVTNRATMAVMAPALSSTDYDELSDEKKLLVSRLADTLSMTREEVIEKLTTTREGALDLRMVAFDVSMKTVSYITEHATDFPDVEVQAKAVREYPYGSLAAHVLGYTGEISDSDLENPDFAGYEPSDVVGKAGAERAFESVLQGVRGTRTLEVDASGKARQILEETPAESGQDVTLTIDISVQKVAEAALADACKTAQKDGFKNAKAGSAVVLDVTNGEVVAMANIPTYAPADFIGGIPAKVWKQMNSKTSNYPLTNRATMSMYPPASTFKTLEALGALNDGFITAATTFNCSGSWTWKDWNRPWKCWNHYGHGNLNLRQAIEESCDVYFYNVGERFYEDGDEKLQEYVRSLGLGSPTGIELPGEASGRVPDAAWKKKWNEDYPEMQQWNPGDTINMSIGQGDLLVTPLQMAVSYATIANGGDLLTPHLLKKVSDTSGKTVYKQERTLAKTQPKASKSSINTLKTALRGVISEGTGKSPFRGFDIAVAGKTGTAQMQGGKQDDYAWFVGYAPADKPKYCIAILIEQGGHGGSIAGPAARQIFAKLFNKKVEHVNAVDNSF